VGGLLSDLLSEALGGPPTRPAGRLAVNSLSLARHAAETGF
jgi:hypothetical protein